MQCSSVSVDNDDDGGNNDDDHDNCDVDDEARAALDNGGLLSPLPL